MQEITRKPELAFYVDHVNAYEREAKTWETRSKKIVKRYRDHRGDERKQSRFNILWSNVQTLHPALYDGTPTPNVDRRYEDDEEVNTTVAHILERSVSYFVKTNDFNDCMEQAVLDRLLPGRGTVWVRYVPHFKDIQVVGGEEEKQKGAQVTDDVTTGDDVSEELYSEDVVLDYVHWQDYGHNVARTWQENRMVWRRVYLSRKEIMDRFPDTSMANGAFIVPLDAKPLGKKEDDGECNKSTIYELWDRVTKKVYWFHKDMDNFLDERDDPLGLDGFYPCPKPIYATLANDSLIPTPDYVIYQDQAIELDVLTARIEALNRALKVVGVYDASAEGVQRMLSENVDNKLIPVEQWAVFAEKGGLKGVVDFFPIQMVAEVLIRLYESRERTKQEIYELTGISDIIRGSTNPNETLGAQELKGKYAGLRLGNMQKDVARFSRDAVRIMTEIIANHFSLETLKEVSGVRLLTEQEKQMAMMQMQPPQEGMPAAPLDEITAKLLEKPTWEQVEAVLRENGARCFRIDIETDSTIKADQDAEKAARTEFLTAAGSFIQQAAAVPNPQLQPLLMEMLRFGVSGFKVGREMETEFKVAIDAIKKQGEQPPKEDPNVAAQAQEAQMKQAEMQMKQGESQAKLQLEGQKLQMDGELSAAELQIKQQELALKQEELALKARELELRAIADANSHKHAMVTAKSAASPEVAMTDPEFNEGANPLMMLADALQASSQQTNDALLQIAQMQQEGNQALIAAVTRPKVVKRNPKTNQIEGVE